MNKAKVKFSFSQYATSSQSLSNSCVYMIKIITINQLEAVLEGQHGKRISTYKNCDCLKEGLKIAASSYATIKMPNEQ